MHGRPCPLPHMTLPVWTERRKAQASTTLSMNVSGTECYDFSSMGSNKALTGPTCQTLSVWIEQRRRAQEARSLYKVGSWGSVASGYLSWAMGDPADFLFILWSEKTLAHLALQDMYSSFQSSDLERALGRHLWLCDTSTSGRGDLASSNRTALHQHPVFFVF